MTLAPRIGRVVAAIAQGCARRPWLTLAVSVILAAAAITYTVRTLDFVTSAVALLPQKARYVALMKEYRQEFGHLNEIVVAVDAPSPGMATAYAERLSHALRVEAGIPNRLAYRLDPEFTERRGLLYMSVADLTRLRDRLLDGQDFVEGYAARPTLPQLIEGFSGNIARGIAGALLDLGLGDGPQGDLRALEAIIDLASARLQGPAPYVSPWASAFSMGRFDEAGGGYFFSSERRLLFMFVEPQQRQGDFAENRELVAAIRATIRGLQREFPGVQAGVTGPPAISNDEMVTALGDSQLATVLAGVATLALLFVSFRRVTAPLLMLATLVLSLAWTMGLVTLIVGHLTIFSVMFISIVIGIGIDYGIYFLYRYDEERALGAGVRRALHRTAERAGPGMALGALTAAGTFLVLLLTDFQGIREFGIVSGTALLSAFVSMITLFPALLMLSDHRGRRPRAPATQAAAREARWLTRVTAHRLPILAGGAVITALAAYTAARVGFDDDMLKLQAHGTESVVWEKRILSVAGRSGFTALATAGSLEELARKEEAFAALSSVSRVESVLRLVPEAQAEKMKLIAQFAPLVAPLRVSTSPPWLEVANLRAPLTSLKRRLDLVAEAADTKAGRDAVALRTKTVALLDRLERADAAAGVALDTLQRELADDFADKIRRLQRGLEPHPIGVADLPPELHRRYVGKTGRLLLRVNPAVDIWQREGAERFVLDLRTVDADVTGPPVTSFEAIRLIRRGYQQGTLYAFVLVAGIALAVLGTVRGTLLALTPLVLSVLWTVGVMPLFGLHFNLANVWALPLIVGASAEYGLNMFTRFLEGLETGGPTLARSSVAAVFLNGLTTIGGFASLMVAHHQGIFGLGLLLTLGAMAGLLSSLIVLPVLVARFGRSRPRRRRHPGPTRTLASR